MASIINNRNVGDVRKAFTFYFPEDLNSFKDGKFSSGDLDWASRRAFTEFIYKETKVTIDPVTPQPTLIEVARKAIEGIATHPEKPVEGNMPEDLKQKEEEAARVDEETKKSIAHAKEVTEKQIEAQQKAHDIKGKIYAKVELLPRPDTPEADQVIEDFLIRNEGELNQQSSVDQMADFLEQQITPTLISDYSADEIQGLSRKAAEDYIEVINNPQIAAAYEEAAIQDAILGAVANSENVQEITRQAAGDILFSRRAGIETSRQIVEGVFGKQFGQKFGRLPSEINVSLFDTLQAGVTNEIDFGKLNTGYGEFLQKHLAFINEVASFAGDPRNYLLTQLGKAVNISISRLPADSIARGIFGNATVKNVFSFAVGRPVTITFSSTSWAGGMAIRSPGGLKVVNAVGGIYGVNFNVAGKTTGAAVAGISEIGKDAATKAAGGAFSKIAGGAAGAVSGLSVAATVTAATAPFLGPLLAPVAGFLADIFVGIIGKEALHRISLFIQKHKEDFVAFTAAMFGLGLFRTVPAMIGFGLAGYGLAIAYTNGISGLGNFLFRVGSGLGGIELFKSIVKTLIIVFVVIPILVAFVLLIINSGAYVVPPGPAELTSTNPYISVDKTANPSGQVASPTSVTYTITIAAKKDSLTDIVITSDCNATKKGGSLNCPAETLPTPPTSIAAGTPFTFNITSNYGAQFQDSLVSNTVNVKATSPTGGVVTEIGSSSVCFGKCPLDCFAFPDNYWPANSDVQKLKNLLTTAAATLAGQYPNFAAKVCAKGTVNLCYKPSALPAGIFGWHEHSANSICDIDFNNSVASYGTEGTLYLLAHEATHHVQTINPGLLRQFEDKVAPAEPEICTYGGTDSTESMAEGDGLFVAKPIIYAKFACVSPSYQSKYPKHYDFAKNVMFAP